MPFEARTILNIPLSHSLPEDQIIWAGNKKGEFSVKSAYYIATKVLDTKEEGESSSGDAWSPLWKKLWHLNIPPKVRIFAWKMCMNALPNLENLQRRGINTYDIFPACGKEPESNLHIFVKCEIARRVWSCWVNSPINMLNVNMDIIDIALELVELGTSSDLEVFFGVAWAIWHNRNKIVHEAFSHHPDQIWFFAKKHIHEFKSEENRCWQSSAKAEGKWTAPPCGSFKINVDGATSENERNSSVGVVIRDVNGKVLAACCSYLQGQYSVEEVEAMAMERGVLLAKDLKLPHIILESDALNVVSNITAANSSGWLGHVYHGILGLLSSFSSWNVKHVKRDYNKAAHILAQYARQKEESYVWEGVCPPVLAQVIQEEEM